MDVKQFIYEQVALIRETVGQGKAINALSGGVDSSVVTALGHKAIGDQLETVFLDDGLMREKEPEEVAATFEPLGIPVRIVDLKDRFFSALKGIEDPEEKRKAFRDTFYTCFGEIVKESGASFLLQGTIKADIIETQKGVKTQHNILEQIGIDPEAGYGFKVIEPLIELFKPDVRQVATGLGLPEAVAQRMPFPGPGLATRCLGEANRERIEIVRKAVRIVEEETKDIPAFQCFAVLLKDRATGLKKDGSREFGHIIVVRCVESENAMTAEPVPLPWDVLRKLEHRIAGEIEEVSRVLYDLTPKPPATIEYI
jgi:GMP synthase (glutamine-hydrolysing)